MRTTPALFLASALALSACKSQLDDKPAAAVKESTPASEAADPAEKSQAGLTILELDPAKSTIGFVGAKVTDDHEGTFEAFEGKVKMDGDTVAGLDLVVKIDSMKIEPEKLRGHLLSGDFFDAETIPEAKFVSRAIRPKADGGNTHEIEGDLTLHGVTKTITFPAKVEVGDQVAHGTANFKINRKDFDMTYPGMPDDLIKDEVLLQLDLVAPRTDAST